MPTLARGTLLLKLADARAEHREALAQLESLLRQDHHFGRMLGLELDQSVAFLRSFRRSGRKVTSETLNVSLPIDVEKYTATFRQIGRWG